ncbi:hypothetical protein GCM10027176_46430 [Actinoallomurus bryophytorum]
MAVRTNFRAAFPADYKALCGRYGLLEIDAFMGVDHAGIPANIAVKLDDSRCGIDLLRVLTDKYGFIFPADDSGDEVQAEPYPYHPEPGGLYPWGATQNGDTLFWLTAADPDRWTIVVTDGGSWCAGALRNYSSSAAKTLRTDCPERRRRR